MPNASRSLGVSLPFVFSLALFACHSAESASSGEAVPLREGPGELGPTSSVGTLPGDVVVSMGGEAKYTVSIDVPPGRMNMQPALALSYAGNDARGMAGKGFSLTGLSSVTRCSRTTAVDGRRSVPTYSDEDAFCLDGARLIEVGSRYGLVEYKTEEHSLALIFATPGVNGPSRFTVYRPDGSRAEYGEPAHRAGVELSDEDTIAAWRISRVEDEFGNFLTYTYTQPNFPDPGPRGALSESYIDFIEYTGHTSGDAPNKRVEFEYEATPDPRHGFVRGLATMQTQRLRAIRTTLDDAAVDVYELSYENDSASRASRLVNVRRCANAPAAIGATLNDDGFVCMPPTRFEWSRGDLMGILRRVGGRGLFASSAIQERQNRGVSGGASGSRAGALDNRRDHGGGDFGSRTRTVRRACVGNGRPIGGSLSFGELLPTPRALSDRDSNRRQRIGSSPRLL